LGIEHIAEYDRRIEKVAKEVYLQVAVLKQVKGVGPPQCRLCQRFFERTSPFTSVPLLVSLARKRAIYLALELDRRWIEIHPVSTR
jgi:hypothetical protein